MTTGGVTTSGRAGGGVGFESETRVGVCSVPSATAALSGQGVGVAMFVWVVAGDGTASTAGLRRGAPDLSGKLTVVRCDGAALCPIQEILTTRAAAARVAPKVPSPVLTTRGRRLSVEPVVAGATAGNLVV